MSWWKSFSRKNQKPAPGAENAQPPCAMKGVATPCEVTWTAPAPSPSYKLAAELEKEELRAKLPKQIPQDVKDNLQLWKQRLIEDHAEQERKAAMLKNGPESPPDQYDVIVLEGGNGKKKPGLGDTVRIGYVVTMQVDASIVEVRNDMEYTLGGKRGEAAELKVAALEAALVRMHRGGRSIMKCPLRAFFEIDSKAVQQYGEDSLAVCEVKLSEIYQTKDCSFIKDSGVVFKEIIHEGVGAWCDNPTDEGSANVRIEEICNIHGDRLFPKNGEPPLEQEVVVGNGQVCDALECALPFMKRHETAIIRCKDPALCVGNASIDIDASLLSSGATFRVALLDFAKGPDVFTFDEEDRLKFAFRRKVEANRLFNEGRFHLARERYQNMIEFFHHMDKKKFRDRFLGRPETLSQCKLLRKQCRLNAAACSLRVRDPHAAKELCDSVLCGDPENTKALYRRAQAFVQQEDYVQACLDLTRVLEIDASILEARRLLEDTRRRRHSSDQKQSQAFKFGRSVDGLNDPRTIKNDYMDTPMDLPNVEGQPVSSCWMPGTKK